MRTFIRFLTLSLVLLTLVSCAAPQQASETGYVDAVTMETVELEDEAIALAASPAAVSTMLTAEASGISVNSNSEATIDYSNTGDGYVMVKYTASTTKRLKAQVKGPATTYTYNLTPGKWEVFPLSDGNGSYKITVYRNAYSNKYASVLSVTTSVSLTDEFAPFLRPNQYVDYSAAPKAVEKAAELTAGLSDPLDMVEAVYDYVVGTLTYDNYKASTVKSGYLPVLDTTLAEKKGICFDYAALMTGMLRSQGIPCKMIFGYAGSVYHAWINVWTEDTGWVDGVIYFDGMTWQHLDPTFASSANQNSSVEAYIGNGSNYTEKYMY